MALRHNRQMSPYFDFECIEPKYVPVQRSTFSGRKTKLCTLNTSPPLMTTWSLTGIASAGRKYAQVCLPAD